MEIAFITANYVARESNYSLHPFEWRVADETTRRAFEGPDFEEKFLDLMSVIRSLGFKYIELWNPHLPIGSDIGRIQVARSILTHLNLEPIAYYYSIHQDTPWSDVRRAFQIASALGSKFLVGVLEQETLSRTAELCQEFGLKYALENHSEKTPEILLHKIEKYTDWIGIACDTGWWGTQGFDAVSAIRLVQDHLLHVHLKDVQEVGTHHTCAYGEGIVDVRGVVEELGRMGYKGYLAVEHEPEDFDPTDDIRTCVEQLSRWLGPRER
ncbi:MAG: sugar phosphate isomerase/epimerase [Alicyclobacillus sp.]|nr:sugar phosphate isomerase/epimerase [Alicyclobacillus sp.]